MNKMCLWLAAAFLVGASGCGFKYGTHWHDEGLNRHHEYAKEDPDVRGKREDLVVSEKRWSVKQGGYLFEFHASPEEPGWDEKTLLELSIFDISTSTPQPIAGAQIACKATMRAHTPAMRGIIHNYKTHTAHVERTPGTYGMPIIFGVGGDWAIAYQVRVPSGRNFNLSFDVRVKRSPDPVQEWNKMTPVAPKPADWK